jgi:glycosyltransferase involved in cell wall biosynthesis
MIPRTPAVSIVTICKDNEIGLGRTVESVRSQSFQDWILTIVVGDSKDDSFDLAKRLEKTDERIKLIRQEGSGIYEAMNIGASNSDGDFIWFLNSGDIFFDHYTLDETVETIRGKTFGFLVGNYSLRDVCHENYTKFARLNRFRFVFNRKGGCHQAMVFSRQYFSDVGGYDTRYKISSDFDLCCKLLGIVPCYTIARINCVIEGEGFSDTNLLRMHLEKYRIRNITTRPRYLLLPFNLLWTTLAILKMRIKSKTSISRITAKN